MAAFPVTEIVRAACDALGGAQYLARSLGARESDVLAWIDGRLEPPFGTVIAAAELAARAHALAALAPRRLLAFRPRDCAASVPADLDT